MKDSENSKEPYIRSKQIKILFNFYSRKENLTSGFQNTEGVTFRHGIMQAASGSDTKSGQ